MSLRNELLFLGREYPLGYPYFRSKLKSAFLKKRDLVEKEEIKKSIADGEYVIKGNMELLSFEK
ncbi:hypothetical protein G9A89_011718 [Geosiphon pyriformis]|nr:hypothetical protein G9A89_011718 [Geosiphon pyriformis]